MKMKAYLYWVGIVWLALGLCPASLSQDNECGTPSLDEATAKALPWYDNNQMLYDYLEDKGYYDNSTGGPGISLKNGDGCWGSRCDPIPYLVPLNIWVYRDDNGNGPTGRAEVHGWLNEVNRMFETADTGIQFYIRSFSFQDNDNYYTQINSYFDMFTMFAAKGISNSDAFNIHFIRQSQGSIDAPGTAVLPHGLAVPGTRYSAFVRTHWLGNNTPMPDLLVFTTLAHELGHTLGLLHPHNPGRLFSQIFNNGNGTISNGCYQESVSRTRENRFFNGCLSTGGKIKCEINGDFLCDTAADPNVSGRVNGGCGYITPASGDFRADNWGELWQPPTRNIMAYTNRACRTEFTEGQIAIMWMTLENWFQTRTGAEIMGADQLACFPATTTLTAPVFDQVLGYNWSVSTHNIDIVGASNGSQLTIRPETTFSNGFGCATLSVITPYGTFCMTKEMLPSKPPPVTIASNSPSPYEVCANSSVTFRANMANFNGVTGFMWSVSAGTIAGGQGTRFVTVNTPNANQNITVNVRVTNACGTTTGFTRMMTRTTVNGFACQAVILPKLNIKAQKGE